MEAALMVDLENISSMKPQKKNLKEKGDPKEGNMTYSSQHNALGYATSVPIGDKLSKSSPSRATTATTQSTKNMGSLFSFGDPCHRLDTQVQAQSHGRYDLSVVVQQCFEIYYYG